MRPEAPTVTDTTEGIDEILLHLARSIEDELLSDEERETLARLLREVSPSEEGLRRIRNAAFSLIRNRLEHSKEPYALFKWLEKVVRCIDNSRVPVIPHRSVAYFSPGEACRSAIVNRLDQARNKVCICVFTISDNSIAESIVKSHRRGVNIRIITDDDKMADLGSDIDHLKNIGIPVIIDTPEARMHHKFALFDGIWLITGSYNWTRAAKMINEENLIETNDPDLIRQFGRQFELLWQKFGG